MDNFLSSNFCLLCCLCRGSVSTVVQSFRDLMLQDTSDKIPGNSQSPAAFSKSPPVSPRQQSVTTARKTPPASAGKAPPAVARAILQPGSSLRLVTVSFISFNAPVVCKIMQCNVTLWPCRKFVMNRGYLVIILCPPISKNNLPAHMFKDRIKESSEHNNITQTVYGSMFYFSWGLPARNAHPAPTTTPSPTSPVPASSPPDNPWQRFAAASPPAGASASVSFTDIVRDEIHQRETLEKATQKPLHLIQVCSRGLSCMSINLRGNVLHVLEIMSVPLCYKHGHSLF